MSRFVAVALIFLGICLAFSGPVFAQSSDTTNAPSDTTSSGTPASTAAPAPTGNTSSDKVCLAPDATHKYLGSSSPAKTSQLDVASGEQTSISNLSKQTCTQTCPAGSAQPQIQGVCVSQGVCKATETCAGTAPQLPNTNGASGTGTGNAGTDQISSATPLNVGSTPTQTSPTLSAGSAATTPASTGGVVPGQSLLDDLLNPASLNENGNLLQPGSSAQATFSNSPDLFGGTVGGISSPSEQTSEVAPSEQPTNSLSPSAQYPTDTFESQNPTTAVSTSCSFWCTTVTDVQSGMSYVGGALSNVGTYISDSIIGPANAGDNPPPPDTSAQPASDTGSLTLPEIVVKPSDVVETPTPDTSEPGVTAVQQGEGNGDLGNSSQAPDSGTSVLENSGTAQQSESTPGGAEGGVVGGEPGNPANSSDQADQSGAPTGSQNGTPNGSPAGAGTADNGSPKGSPAGATGGTVGGAPTGSVSGTPAGTPNGSPTGSAQGTSAGSPNGVLSAIGAFFSGLISGFSSGQAQPQAIAQVPPPQIQSGQVLQGNTASQATQGNSQGQPGTNPSQGSAPAKVAVSGQPNVNTSGTVAQGATTNGSPQNNNAITTIISGAGTGAGSGAGNKTTPSSGGFGLLSTPPNGVQPTNPTAPVSTQPSSAPQTQSTSLPKPALVQRVPTPAPTPTKVVSSPPAQTSPVAINTQTTASPPPASAPTSISKQVLDAVTNFLSPTAANATGAQDQPTLKQLAQRDIKIAQQALTVAEGLWSRPDEQQVQVLQAGRNAAQRLVSEVQQLGNTALANDIRGYVAKIDGLKNPENQNLDSFKQTNALGDKLVESTQNFLTQVPNAQPIVAQPPKTSQVQASAVFAPLGTPVKASVAVPITAPPPAIPTSAPTLAPATVATAPTASAPSALPAIPGSINSVTDRAAVAQQAYQIARTQGILPSYLSYGNPNYGVAWKAVVQATMSALAARGMLNPQLDLASTLALARQETGIPGNLREFQSTTGVRGFLQVTGGSAVDTLGNSVLNTWQGPWNSKAFAREDNIGSIVTGMINFDQLLYQCGGNVACAAQTYNSGSPNGCAGQGCTNGVPTYGIAVAQDTNVMRSALKSAGGNTTAMMQQLNALYGNRSTGSTALAAYASILSGSSVAPIPCGYQGCPARSTIPAGNLGYDPSIMRVSQCPSTGLCYTDAQTGASGVPSDPSMTQQQFLQAAREDATMERLAQAGQLPKGAQFQTFKATQNGTTQTYSITDQNGNTVGTNIPLSQGSVDQNGNVRLLADAQGNPLGQSGPLQNGQQPLGNSSALAQPSVNPNNPNNYSFPDTRPLPPVQPQGQYNSGSSVGSGANTNSPQQGYCLVSTQPIVAVPCANNGQPQPPYQTQPQILPQPLPMPLLPPLLPPTTATSTTPAVTLVANPTSVASGNSSRLSWSSVGTVSCEVGTQGESLIGTTTSGSAFTSILSATTIFAAVCETTASTTISATTSVTVQ